jgi:hypothetical protein
MAATQALSTGSNDVASTIRRRSAGIVICASCGKIYNPRELFEADVRTAHTRDGRNFYAFACSCGNGTSVAGAVAYDPSEEIARTSPPKGDVSHCRKASDALSLDSLREARERVEAGLRSPSKSVGTAARTEVVSRMDATQAKLAAFVARMGGNASATPVDAKAFVTTLSSTCKSLVRSMIEAQSNVEELDAACSVIAGGEVPDELLQDNSLTSESITGTLQSIYASIDGASMRLFKRHLAVSK